jgi:hypothetical protein
MKQSRNEVLQAQLESFHATLQETKKQMVDLATIEFELQASCLPLETLSKEMLVL